MIHDNIKVIKELLLATGPVGSFSVAQGKMEDSPRSRSRHSAEAILFQKELGSSEAILTVSGGRPLHCAVPGHQLRATGASRFLQGQQVRVAMLTHVCTENSRASARNVR